MLLFACIGYVFTHFYPLSYGKIKRADKHFVRFENCCQVGFDNGQYYYSDPRARTPEILSIADDSDIGINGRWMFRVDGSQVLLPNCSAVPGKLSQLPFHPQHQH